MKTVQNSCKFLTCLVGISFLSLAQAKWMFENGKLSNDTTPDEAYCVFPAQIATLEDGAGNNITGLQIIGINEKSAKLIDFTSVKTDTGYKVISVAVPEFARNCREFIGPDVFDLTTNMFMTTKTIVSGKTTTKLQVYITNIVISANIMQFPAKWAMNAPLKTLKPTQFPYLKSFGDRCFYNCTNFQADASQLIMRGVTNIGNEAFKEVSLEGELILTNLHFLGQRAFYFEGVNKKIIPRLKRITVAGSIEKIFASCFQNSYNLEYADFNGCSQLRSIGDNAFMGCSNLVSDISLIANSTITNIGSMAFYDAPVSGKLILHNIQNIGAAAFSLTTSYTKNKAALEIVDLPSSLTNVYLGSFSGQAKVSSLTFGAERINIYKGSASATFPILTNIWFKGYCPSADGLPVVANSLTAGSTCIIYASTNLTESTASENSWANIAVAATEEELAKLSPSDRVNCFGIYQDSKGLRKAYLVQRRSPYEPKSGIQISVR